MQPQKKTLKKKIKNKNWNVMEHSQNDYAEKSPHVSTDNQRQSKYDSITKMSEKYTFNINAIMGCGFASTVYLGTRNSNNEMVCIKAVDLMVFGSSHQYIDLLHKQIQFLQKFNSDYIVKLYDIYESPTFCYLVMQICPGGDLYKMLKISPAYFPSSFISNIIEQIAHGLQQLHDKGIVHRDLKTQNIFILSFPKSQGEKMRVKIGDLGFCITVQQINIAKQQGKTLEDLGSPIYMSPEISISKTYSFASDIYALGIIWYELYHKKAPWEALSQIELLQKKTTQKAQIWRKDIESSIKQMIQRCICNDVEKRPNCQQIIKLLKSQNQKK